MYSIMSDLNKKLQNKMQKYLNKKKKATLQKLH